MDLETITTLRIMLRYFAMLVSFSGVVVIIFSFIGVFTRKKAIKYIITFLIAFICIVWYYESRPQSKVIRMQEDVLYIKPKTK